MRAAAPMFLNKGRHKTWSADMKSTFVVREMALMLFLFTFHFLLGMKKNMWIISFEGKKGTSIVFIKLLLLSVL